MMISDGIRDWVDRSWQLVGPFVVPGLAAVVGLVLCVAVVRWWRVRCALGHRDAGKVLLPSMKFEPCDEEIVRVAAVLSRVHRVTRSPFSRCAYSVRVRLSPNDDGLVVWSLEGHDRARSILDLVSYDQTEARPLHEGDLDDVSI